MEAAVLIRKYRQWWTDPKRVARRNEANRRAMQQARDTIGSIRLRLAFSVYTEGHRRRKARRSYHPINGSTLSVTVPEVGDAWELLRDLQRFVTHWRPSRQRPQDQARIDRAWRAWSGED